MTSELQTTPDPFVQPSLIGGDGGGEFSCCGGADGKRLHEIEVWAGRFCLKAITVRLTNDTTARTFGSIERSPWKDDKVSEISYKKFTFNPDERITRLSIWSNALFGETSDGFRQFSMSTRVGRIHFKTDHDREFDIGMYYLQLNPKAEVSIPVGSGICVGVRGRAGWDMDSLGFVFLKPVVGTKLVVPERTLKTTDTDPSTSATDNNNGSSSGHNEDENQTSARDATEGNPGADVVPGNDIMRAVFDAFEAMPQPPQQSQNDVVAEGTLGMTSIRRMAERLNLLESRGFVINTVEPGPSYDDMLEWIDSNIAQKANVTISEMWELDSRNYLVTVDSEEARRVVFMRSPFYLKEKMVLILPWWPDYGSRDMQPKLIPTWVNIHGVGPLLSEEGEELLAAIGPVLGSEKDCSSWPPRLRGCVLLDMKQPQPSRLEISVGEKKKLELLITYEKPPDVCFACHKRGHTADICDNTNTL